MLGRTIFSGYIPALKKYYTLGERGARIVMAFMSSPGNERTRETRKRLDHCWDMDIAWNKYPGILTEVSRIKIVPHSHTN